MGEAIQVSKLTSGGAPLTSRNPDKKDGKNAELGALNGLKKKWFFGRMKDSFREKELERKAQAELLRTQFLKDGDESIPTKFAVDEQANEHAESSVDTFSTLDDAPAPRKQIKKSRSAQALRGHAWNALEASKAGGRTLKRSLTDTTRQLRQAATEAVRQTGEQLRQGIQQTGRKLRDAQEPGHVQVAKRKSEEITPELLEEVKADLAREERYRNKLIGVCIPNQVRAGMRSKEVMPFLKRVAAGRPSNEDAGRQKDLAHLVAHAQRAKTGINYQIQPGHYAKGLLDCHAALEKNPELFDRTEIKTNWLPPTLRKAFRDSGMREPRDWLLNMNRLRTEYNDIKRLEAKGELTADRINGFHEHCRKLKVPHELVTNKAIKLNHAFSYLSAWQSAYDNRNFTHWVGYGGKTKPLDPDAVEKASSVTKLDEQQIGYYVEADKPELKSADQIAALLGSDKAARFGTEGGARFADQLLVEVYDQKLAPTSILNAKVMALDWTFSRDDAGDLAVSYRLQAKDSQGARIVVEGKAELNRKGEAVPASKIEVSMTPGKAIKPALADQENASANKV